MADGLCGISVIQLARPFSFESPFKGGDFALLLVASAPDITPDEQWSLCEAFVAQGCRYAVCTGVAASSWDDAIDHASIDAELKGQRSKDRLIMTTWHDDEPLAEVARFFLNHTAFDDFVPTRRVAVLLGGAGDDVQALRTALEEARGGPPKS